MTMDRSKIIFISVMGILLCGAVWGFIAIYSSDAKKKANESDVSLTAAPVQEERLDVDNRSSMQTPGLLGGRSQAQEVGSQENAPIEVRDYFPEDNISAPTEESDELERIQREILAKDNASVDAARTEQRRRELTAQLSAAGGYPMDTVPKQEKEKPSTASKIKKKVQEKIEEVVAPEPEKPSRFSKVATVQQAKTNSIRALVHSQQTVQVGSTLKMRITEDCMTDNGVLVKKNSFVFGQVTEIKNERVIVKITTVNVNGSILPFSKDVYSRDAQKGIYVPNTTKSESIKDAEAGAAGQTNGNISVPMGGIGTQLGVSAINGATQGVKQAVTKNIRRTKVTIKTNYELLFMESGIDEDDFDTVG